MKRLTLAASAAMLALAMFAAPAAADEFPSQGKPQSCEVLQTLPKDVIGQIAAHSPETAEALLARLTDACS